MKITVILGGPGAGKTRRLLSILSDILSQGVPVEEVAYLSYTRQGTYQGVEIAREQFDLDEKQCTYLATLHSILFHHYALTREDIFSEKDAEFFAKHIGVENVEDYLRFLDMQRNNSSVAALMYDELALDSYTTRYVEANYKAYKECFKKHDFTDLIERAVKEKLVLPVREAIVDEAQDLTTLHWRALHTLFRDVDNLYLAGDPNQSIYDWAGADYKYFMRINADKVEVLDETYRLPRTIWLLGKQIHAMIDVSTPYPQKCKDEEGVLQEVGAVEDVPLVKDKTYLYLARANVHLEQVEKMFRENGILYTNSEGQPAISRKKIRFIRAYYTYMKGGKLSAKQKDALNKFMTDEQLAQIKQSGSYDEVFATTLNWFDADYAYAIGTNENYNKSWGDIRVATMHKVKGAEADVVVVLCDATKRTLRRFQDDPDAELRVLFVALTRARHELYIVRSSSKYGYPITAIQQGVRV